MKIFLRLLGPLIFLLIVYFYVDLIELKAIMLNLRWPYFLITLSLAPLLVFLRSYRWRDILASYNILYSKWTCFKLSYVELVAVMVVATFGTFIKIFYLKRDGHGLLNSVLSILVDKYFDFLLPLFFGIISAFLLWMEVQPAFGLFLFFTLALISFYPIRTSVRLIPPNLIPNKIRELFRKHGWRIEDHLVQIHQILNFRLYLYSVIAFGIYFVCIYFLNASLQLKLNLFQIVLIMTITSLIALIPVSFLGIGSRDAGLVLVFNWFGHTAEQAIALSMALLFFRIAVLLMGSIFWILDPPPLNEIKSRI